MCSVHRIEAILLAALLGAGLWTFLPAGASADRPVGEVVLLVGSAYAEAPGMEPRPLACGDLIHDGENVVVDSDSRLGVLRGEVYSQLEESSQLGFGMTQEAAPDLILEAGRVRVLDTRIDETAARHRLATPHAAARGLSTDSEAYVLDEKAGIYSMACEWGSPLDVARLDGAEPLIADPGECVVAKLREPLYKASAHEQRIALLGLGLCDPGPILGPVASRFSTTDVAAPPPPSRLLPPAPPAFKKEPCESVGCTIGGAPAPPSLGVIESPVSPGGPLPPGSLPGPTTAAPPPTSPGATPGTLPGLGGN
jgi:hypothetical protein